MKETPEQSILRLIAIIEGLAGRVAELEYALHGPQMPALPFPVTVH